MLYLIKLNIILAILCLMFQVLMHRDTYFSVRRFMLLGIYAAALLLPLLDIQALLQGRVAALNMASDYATYVLPTLEVTARRVGAAEGGRIAAAGGTSWDIPLGLVLGIAYLVPVAWLTLKLLWQTVHILYIRFTCVRTEVLGQRVFLYPEPCSPFSFGRWIFLHLESIGTEAELREVLLHEQTHVHQWHTLDIFLAQFFCILFWWNPAAWVLRREVRLNLEFIADAAVVGHDADRRTYQFHLLGLASQMNVATLVNNFNVLPLKRRIVMMNSKRTRPMGMLKYILFVPAAAAVVLLGNIDAMARTIAREVKPLAAPIVQQRQQAPVATSMQARQTDAPGTDVAEPQAVLQREISVAEPEPVVEALPEGEIVTDTVLAPRLYILDGNVSTKEEVESHKHEIVRARMLDLNEAQQKWGSRGANGVLEAETRGYQERAVDKPDVMPEYPGGIEAMYRFLTEHVKYPALAQELGTQGRVIVQFIVSEEGLITNVTADKVLEANGLKEVTVVLHKEGMMEDEIQFVNTQNKSLERLKSEAVRVVKEMPHWKPGTKDGKPVPVRFSLPITFRLSKS